VIIMCSSTAIPSSLPASFSRCVTSRSSCEASRPRSGDCARR
jgi:hypothetical protein